MASRLWALPLYGARMFGAVALTAAASGGAGVVFCDKEPPPYLDPEAWERAAKALRDINAQPNAKKVGLRADAGTVGLHSFVLIGMAGDFSRWIGARGCAACRLEAKPGRMWVALGPGGRKGLCAARRRDVG